jgi:hypothetical protein
MQTSHPWKTLSCRPIHPLSKQYPSQAVALDDERMQRSKVLMRFHELKEARVVVYKRHSYALKAW